MNSPAITQEQLHKFHSIDREVFSRMVINLMRDPGESLIVIAAWLWLDHIGYPNVIILMACLSDDAINILSDETAAALASLQHSISDLPSLSSNCRLMPATSAIMSQNITAEVFHRQRFAAIIGIKNFLTTICARVFVDILQLTCPISISIGELGNAPLEICGFPHPLFGDLRIIPPNCRLWFQPRRDGIDNFIPAGGLWAWGPTYNVTLDDKTLFLTFSRGSPVTKGEVVELFARKYGERSVVDVIMQENVVAGGDQQPLFARMMLSSVAVVDQVLGGDKIAKFQINGKHIWARKYERREQTSMTTTIPPP